MLASHVAPVGRASAGVSEGSLAFAGTATLPTFPCRQPDIGQSPCVGTFTASTFGRMAGTHGAFPWQVSLQSLTQGSFGYTDHIEPGVPCSEGIASGSASLDTEATGQAFGTYHETIVPRPVRKARMSYEFTWLRRGATALLELRRVMVELHVDGLGWVTVQHDGRASAVATFFPHLDPAHPPSGCTGGEPTSLQGSFFGVVSGITNETF